MFHPKLFWRALILFTEHLKESNFVRESRIEYNFINRLLVEVILMDEPCSALDPIATAKVEELISELSTQYTIVIVTHSVTSCTGIHAHRLLSSG